MHPLLAHNDTHFTRVGFPGSQNPAQAPRYSSIICGNKSFRNGRCNNQHVDQFAADSIWVEESPARAWGNVSFAVAAAAVDRSANGAAQQHDRGSHETASRRCDSTGGSTRSGSGFCATNHRRGRFRKVPQALQHLVIREIVTKIGKPCLCFLQQRFVNDGFKRFFTRDPFAVRKSLRFTPKEGPCLAPSLSSRVVRMCQNAPHLIAVPLCASKVRNSVLV